MASNDANIQISDQKYQMNSSNVHSRDIKTQNTIQEIMQILQEQKEAFLKEKVNDHKIQIRQKVKEGLDFRKMQTYQKSMLLRQPFLSRPRNNFEYFERDNSKYLKRDATIPDKDPIYNLLPERAKNPQGFHIASGNDTANFITISKVDEKKMGKKERIRYQMWEEIRKQKEKEQQEMDGSFKRSMYYDQNLQSKPKIFKPSDSRSSLFTINPSSVYDVPRTPRSNLRLIQLNRNLERNQKWNPNNSSDGMFDRDIFKESSPINSKSLFYGNQ